ncbi:hypothetical protein ACF0H5_001769 [Mactra antiquata]
MEEERNKLRLSIQNRGNILAALFVRSLLVLHCILVVWRVVIAYNDLWMWCILFANIPLLLETFMVIYCNGGNEWKWWCPCFLLYLMATLPSIWMLQLSQNDKLQDKTQLINVTTTPGPIVTEPGLETTSDSDRIFTNLVPFVPSGGVISTTNSAQNVTTSTTALPDTTTINSGILVTIESFLEIEDTTWIVVLQESLMYLIVFGRWILPRAGVSRVALSDLLLIYLAVASDIMELYAVFDEEIVQVDRGVTLAVLTIWSISFLQFVPVLIQKNKHLNMERGHFKRIARACGEHFAEVFNTILSLVIQDGPFLCLRLYLMIRFELVTYSLVFFVLKNFVSVLLLIYRLVILCHRLPCCKKKGKDDKTKRVPSDVFSPMNFSDTFALTNGRYFQKTPVDFNYQIQNSTSPLFIVSHGKDKYLANPRVVNRHQNNFRPGNRFGSL